MTRLDNFLAWLEHQHKVHENSAAHSARQSDNDMKEYHEIKRDTIKEVIDYVKTNVLS